MSSEDPTKQTPATGADNEEPTNSESKDERKPVEELYDLSKPIKRVDRPNKDEHEAELDRLTKVIDDLKEERRVIQQKIDDTIDSSRGSEVNKIRDELSRLRSKKGALISEKKSIRSRLDASRSASERLFEDKKRTKDTMKFTTMSEIEEELKRLQRKQETTSMSLMEEKRLIKEMDALQASKKLVAQLKNKETDLEDAREQRKLISAEIAAKDKEIDDVAAEIDQKSEALKKLSEKETDSRSNMQEMFKERDEIKKKLNDAHIDKNNVRQTFREANNKWYDYQRALRAQRKMQMEEEKRKREEERLAWIKKKEEEEAKKIPYEEEMALCEYLADYLSKTYLKEAAAKEKEEEKKDSAMSLTDNPFAGMKPVNKKNDDEVYLKMGKGKKPRKKGKKQETAKSKKEPFTLNVDTFGQFGLLGLTPPTSHEMVEASVKELREKKQWYSEQPRGSVPTATDIRKANEKAAAESKKDDGADEAPAKSKKKGEFSLSSDDFAPLSTGAEAKGGVVATWGKAVEAATSEPEEEEEETPAEDASEAVEAAA